MTFIYFQREGGVYRTPDDALEMEIWNPLDREWEPYLGDAARIVVEGNSSDGPPAGVE